jgi:hypothetical protein
MEDWQGAGRGVRVPVAGEKLSLHSAGAASTLKSLNPVGGAVRMASVEEKVKQIIVEQLGVDEAEVTANASFIDDLGADSLDTVELVMAFE